jgi:hypothetical protein
MRRLAQPFAGQRALAGQRVELVVGMRDQRALLLGKRLACGQRLGILIALK